MLAKTPVDLMEMAITSEFLSADVLEIFEKQRAALVETLYYMESGVLSTEYFNHDHLKFKMSAWSLESDCGAVCCIGGTACMLAKDSQLFEMFPNGYDNYPMALRRLFFNWSEKVMSVTPERAAEQLRRYLTTGECPLFWTD